MKWRSLFRGIRPILLVGFLGAVLLAVAPGWVILPSLMRDSEVDLLGGRLEAEAQLIAREAAPVMGMGSAAQSDALVKDLGQTAGLEVTIFDAAGTPVAASAANGPQAQPIAGSEVKEALAGGVGRGLRGDSGAGGETLHVAVPIRTDAGIVGAVQVVSPVAGIQKAVGDLRLALAISLVAAAAAVAVFALWLGGRVARPVLRLARAAEDMATGRYEHEPVVRGPDEVMYLGESFGRMARALHGSFASLQAERDRLDAVLRHMADGILIANADGIITLANPAAGRILGINHGYAVGQRLAVVVREHEIIEVARLCLVTDGQSREHAVTVERASPRRYLRAVATRVGDGRETQVLLVLQDLTEMRRLETVRRDFLANVSHELRTPIAAIKAMVETLEDGAIDDPLAARDFVARVHRETDGLAHLVEELLQLSRIESGQAALSLAEVDATDLAARTVERLAPLAERAGVSLATEGSEGALLVQADRERIAQVLTNLLHNAIKFTPPGGRVTVSVHPGEHEVLLTVSDTGAGIAEEDLPRLFERFYKADKARASGGTGLGLAIAKHLVQVHGGRIWAESAGPGQGATFTFTLPVAVPVVPAQGA
ncbi:MAG: HAMP domain-containing sensor histidine kinase [Chloroflexota bacterium]